MEWIGLEWMVIPSGEDDSIEGIPLHGRQIQK